MDRRAFQTDGTACVNVVGTKKFGIFKELKEGQCSLSILSEESCIKNMLERKAEAKSHRTLKSMVKPQFYPECNGNKLKDFEKKRDDIK